MKRTILILFLLSLAVGAATAANVTLSVQSQTAPSGGTVTVPIAIAGASSIGAMDLTVTYDPAILKFVEAKTGALSTNGMVQANGTRPGTVRIAFVDSKGVTGDGAINVAFTAKGANGATRRSTSSPEASTTSTASTSPSRRRAGPSRSAAAGSLRCLPGSRSLRSLARGLP